MGGSRSSDNVGRRSWDERRMSNDNSRRINWRDAEVIHRPSDRRSNYRVITRRVLSGVREMGVREVAIMWEDEAGMSVGCLMITADG
ncbi:hypothetical protein TNCV_4065311 [Trichonephila clavipes]|uniref:Uncharacterized protein n=1 Tax=Trichonephila clavipes TaxID=2585209 RepID=A0A8X6W8V5_TRICX|nr:hypothetical protein TNCV_4065311 [Trichonephila clavipes]